MAIGGGTSKSAGFEMEPSSFRLPKWTTSDHTQSSWCGMSPLAAQMGGTLDVGVGANCGVQVGKHLRILQEGVAPQELEAWGLLPMALNSQILKPSGL